MSLDQQLRAAFSREAEMQNAPTAPDVDRLIIGGRVRQRRRNLARVGVAAAAAVLVAGGVYGVVKIDSGTTVEPAPPQPTTTPQPYREDDAAKIEPGTYRMLAGLDATALALIDADITFDDAGWHSGNYPVLSDEGAYGGVAVYRPSALAARTGCDSDAPNTEVGETPQSLAQQLAQLPRSTVVQSPTPVQAFGREAVHLRLRIDNDCGDRVYRVAETLRGSHGISYSDTPHKVVIDFRVVEVAGVPVVVEMWHDDDASSELVDRIARTRDSITFVTGG
jgi:hypothetical protein